LANNISNSYSWFFNYHANLLFFRKEKNEQLKELEKIKKYGETMKQFTRDKNN
jgi:hypothetical protein